MTRSTQVIEQSQASDKTGASFMRRRSITATNSGGLETLIETDEGHRIITDEPVKHGGSGNGASPLQTVLGALCGCESVTFRRSADEVGFQYDAINFEANFTIDIRGRQGVTGVTPHFRSVEVLAKVRTDETLESLQEVVAMTESRCPVLNLLVDAGVSLKNRWVKVN